MKFHISTRFNSNMDATENGPLFIYCYSLKKLLLSLSIFDFAFLKKVFNFVFAIIFFHSSVDIFQHGIRNIDPNFGNYLFSPHS